MLYRVSPRTVGYVWGQAVPHLARGLRRAGRNRYTVDDIHRWLLGGTHELWVVTEHARVTAVLLTEVYRHPSGKRCCEILLAAGKDAARWLPQAIERIGEYGRLNGATEWRVIGRKGWLRHLKPYGFEQEAVVLTWEAPI